MKCGAVYFKKNITRVELLSAKRISKWLQRPLKPPTFSMSKAWLPSSLAVDLVRGIITALFLKTLYIHD